MQLYLDKFVELNVSVAAAFKRFLGYGISLERPSRILEKGETKREPFSEVRNYDSHFESIFNRSINILFVDVFVL